MHAPGQKAPVPTVVQMVSEKSQMQRGCKSPHVSAVGGDGTTPIMLPLHTNPQFSVTFSVENVQERKSDLWTAGDCGREVVQLSLLHTLTSVI